MSTEKQCGQWVEQEMDRTGSWVELPALSKGSLIERLGQDDWESGLLGAVPDWLTVRT